MMPERPDWAREGRDWPNRRASRFVEADGLRWHVQQMGAGPVALLIHGTGASTHSWRDLAPELAGQFTVIAPDLPGHGFTTSWPMRTMTLPRMARAVAALLRRLGESPVLGIGHSAGAAILLRLALDRAIAPKGLVSLNGALLPFGGPAGFAVPVVAKLLFLNPLAPWLFARRAQDPRAVERVIRNTGSALDPTGIDLYRRLFRHSGHVAGALGMMAGWDLAPLRRDLPRSRVPLLLLAGGNDAAIRPDAAFAVARVVPGARAEILPGLGHLAHEERPDLVARKILEFAGNLGAPHNADSLGAPP